MADAKMKEFSFPLVIVWRNVTLKVEVVDRSASGMWIKD